MVRLFLNFSFFFNNNDLCKKNSEKDPWVKAAAEKTIGLSPGMAVFKSNENGTVTTAVGKTDVQCKNMMTYLSNKT